MIGKCSFFLMSCAPRIFVSWKPFFLLLVCFKNSWQLFYAVLCLAVMLPIWKFSPHQKKKKKMITSPLTSTFVKWFPINIAKCTVFLGRSSLNFRLIKIIFPLWNPWKIVFLDSFMFKCKLHHTFPATFKKWVHD